MRALFLVFQLSACLLLASCCGNEAPVEHDSPNANWKYVTFNRNCGATTGNSFQLSVLAASAQLPNEAANAFIADSNRGAASFVARAEWISSRALQITYSSKAQIFKKEPRVGPIEIRYIEQDDN